MFGSLWRRLAYAKQTVEPESKSTLTGDLEQDIALIKQDVIATDDLIVRRIILPTPKGTPAAIIYVDSMNEKRVIGSEIIGPILDSGPKLTAQSLAAKLVDAIGNSVIRLGDVAYCDDSNSAITAVLEGDCLILVQGSPKALLVGTSTPPTRSIDEPNTEVVVRGSREGFTEAIKTNISMLRRRLRGKGLTIETLTVGERSKTSVGIVYLRDLAATSLVEEVRKRIKQTRIDGVMETGYIEQYIEDEPFTIFSLAANSERPDVIAAKLLEGRVAILVDGTPTVLTVPMLFVEGFQASEDYYSRPYYASLIRFVRYVSFLISFLAPATYVALTSYHQELIPTPLLITMAAAGEGTPFPHWMEVLVMGLIFEILREASLRLPRTVGQAVGIVGTLVIGQAAVDAGLFGAPAVIVIAVTALSTFINTPHADAGAILRILFNIAAAIGGAYAMLILGLVVITHLAGLRSFGAPYFAPFMPLDTAGLKDTVIRAPLWTMGLRPEILPSTDPVRLEPKKTPH